MSDEQLSGPKLYYHGARDEVRLGDRVRIKRWLLRDLKGVVCYIPGSGPRHPDLDVPEEGFQHWAILRDDGMLLQVTYAPEQVQPRRNIILLSRGYTENLSPNLRFP